MPRSARVRLYAYSPPICSIPDVRARTLCFCSAPCCDPRDLHSFPTRRSSDLHRDRGRHTGIRLRELGRGVRARAHAARDRPQAERRARRRARSRRRAQAPRRHGPRREALFARGVRQLRALRARALEGGARRKEVLSYMLRRYWPPTSNSACVICPSEHTRTASISTAKTFSLRITAWRSLSSISGACFAFLA